MTNAYTYSKALGSSSEDGGLRYYLNQGRNYVRLDFDRTHALTDSFLYELPFGANKRWLQSGAGRWILGDWQFNGILTMLSGRPMNFGTTVSVNTPGSSS